MLARIRSTLLAATLSLLAGVTAAAQKTAASPDLQKSIRGIFPCSPKCGLAINLRVLSSEPTPEARFDGDALVAGEVREVWQGAICDTREPIRYEFRFGPDKDGKLGIIGFARVP